MSNPEKPWGSNSLWFSQLKSPGKKTGIKCPKNGCRFCMDPENCGGEECTFCFPRSCPIGVNCTYCVDEKNCSGKKCKVCFPKPSTFQQQQQSPAAFQKQSSAFQQQQQSPAAFQKQPAAAFQQPSAAAFHKQPVPCRWEEGGTVPCLRANCFFSHKNPESAVFKTVPVASAAASKFPSQDEIIGRLSYIYTRFDNILWELQMKYHKLQAMYMNKGDNLFSEIKATIKGYLKLTVDTIVNGTADDRETDKKFAEYYEYSSDSPFPHLSPSTVQSALGEIAKILLNPRGTFNDFDKPLAELRNAIDTVLLRVLKKIKRIELKNKHHEDPTAEQIEEEITRYFQSGGSFNKYTGKYYANKQKYLMTKH